MDFNLLFDSKNNHIQTTMIDHPKATSTLDFFKLTIYSNSLFELDRSRRLRGDIIEHAVDMIDFIDDPVRHFV